MKTKGHSARKRSARGGFTLLEVMISIAILSLALSTIFGSSVLAARGTAHARYVTQAALHAQCRMTQVELKVRRDKLPTDDQTYEDPVESGDEPCCPEGFTCTARLEKIELPSPATIDTATGNALLDRAAQQSRGTTFGGDDAGAGSIGQLAGAMGALSSGGAMGFGAPTGGGGGGAGGLAGNGAPDIGGIATQMLSTIYPTLKPTLEGAIRKATVTVTWHEGSREFSFQVVEYITNPGQTVQAESGPRNTPTGGPPPNPTAPVTITR